MTDFLANSSHRLFQRPGLGLLRCIVLGVTLLALSSGCQNEQDSDATYEEAPRPQQLVQHYQFHRDIKPILEQKCVACHACNDAPCQLKLEAASGLERGASKHKVYDGGRAEDIAPTRLHVDGHSVQDWRQQGFYSVLSTPGQTQAADAKASLLMQMLTLGYQNPVAVAEPLDDRYRLGITRQSQCPTPDEFAEYADDNPQGGMPYGVSGLSANEFNTVKTWLEQGAVIDQAPTPFTAAQQQQIQTQIETWESFLNQPDLKSQLVARYLYEHLFLAHLYFSDIGVQPTPFFQLVRSYRNAPEPIEVVATVRPNDDPGRPIYYRLRPITDTLVHKTHIIYGLNDQRMQRYRALFLQQDWQVDSLPGYDYQHASNPFLAFAAIPARARYQFMLDSAEYFTRTFIRGPVCRGQIATDVIRDQFWVMFEDPAQEQYVSNEDHRRKATPLLGLPGEKSHILDLGSEWLKYQNKRNRYRDLRTRQYHRAFNQGLSLNNIWDGDGHNNNAFLTVFRHHNSASVERGWWGRNPKTLWLMDYPLFERTYYELVVNFNVFGSVSHQAQTRLYFDLIRNGGETNFLQLLPPQQRKAIYHDWYAGSGKIKTAIAYHTLDTRTPTAIPFQPDAPVQDQLIALVQDRFGHLLPADPINRCRQHCEQNPLTRLASAPAAQLPGIGFLPDVTVLRVDQADGDFKLYSLIRDRAHSNVAFMFAEEDRYQPDEDSVTVLDFPISSYPNFMFRVPQAELEDFVKTLIMITTEQERGKLVDRWGVRRTDADFWNNFHSGTRFLNQHRPLESGIFDLNRYLGW